MLAIGLPLYEASRLDNPILGIIISIVALLIFCLLPYCFSKYRKGADIENDNKSTAENKEDWN